jgi:hypothetical protein
LLHFAHGNYVAFKGPKLAVFIGISRSCGI